MHAYVNGQFELAEEAKISAFDRGLLYSDGVFDATRTFEGELFMVDEHLKRLGRSLLYAELDPAPILDEVRRSARELVERDRDEIAGVGDVLHYWIVTRGMAALKLGAHLLRDDGPAKPSIVLLQFALDLAAYAPLYETGVDLGVSLNTRHFVGAVDPRVKNLRGLAAVRGELHSNRVGGAAAAWTVVFADDGSIAEAKGAFLAIICGDRLLRPPHGVALEGVSLEVLCMLASKLGLTVEERRLTLYDFLNADEVLMTASSFQLLPVAAIDGRTVGPKRQHYNALLEAWFELTGVDFVSQAKKFAANVGSAAI